MACQSRAEAPLRSLPLSWSLKAEAELWHLGLAPWEDCGCTQSPTWGEGST